MASDLIAESRAPARRARVESAADGARAGRAGGGFLRRARPHESQGLRQFLFERMYRHYRVNRMASKARRIVQELFRLLLAEPECLPTEWRQAAAGAGTPATARLVADYIAGMTDRFALDEHRRLYDRYAPT